jgi:cytochrome c biogenesis protein CcmG/thiol:disulfide interchange protein DsbE
MRTAGPPLTETKDGWHSKCWCYNPAAMRPRNATTPLVLSWLLLLATLCAFAADETGQPAPRFRAKTTAGDQFNNASVKGKVVLFEFWTTWCKYCEAEASMVDDVAKEFADKGLIVLAVDVLEPDQKVKKYLAEHPRSVPIVLTKDTNLAAMYNAQSYPIYVVIDRDGNIAAEQRGAAGDAALRRLLKRAGLESKSESED